MTADDSEPLVKEEIRHVYAEFNVIEQISNPDGVGQLLVGRAPERTPDDRPTTADGITVRFANGDGMIRLTLDNVQAEELRDALSEVVD